MLAAYPPRSWAAQNHFGHSHLILKASPKESVDLLSKKGKEANVTTLEKWPTYFRVSRISDSVLSQAFTLYFIVGVVNETQFETISKEFNLHAQFEIEEDKIVIASLVNQEQLEKIHKVFEPRASSWRGQYYALANQLVSAIKEVLSS